MRFRPPLISLLLAALAVVGVTGCGQKGPLVPPPKASATLATATPHADGAHAYGITAGA